MVNLNPNGSYKIGDKVVYVVGANILLEVLFHPVSKKLVVRKSGGMGFGQYPITPIRKATEEEIKVKRRI